MSKKFLLERYVVASVLPYVALALLILTAVLFIQQSVRFTEILSAARAPFSLALEITRDVIPGILIFTLPMATLMGIAVGFARMGGDSELIALRAAGAGAWRLAAPMLALGCAAAALTAYDSFVISPAAARSLRDATLRATLDRLESPIQPGTFNMQMPGKVVYVREGDESAGEWGRVFIHWAEPGTETRLVTARKGRIDLSGDQSELVLSDALVTTLPGAATQRVGEAAGQKYITERSSQLRVRLNTGRAALLSQFNRPPDFDEMDLGTLLRNQRLGDVKRQRDAASALHKRLALAASPLAFALLGVGLGGRARRGGRALGAGLSLVSMIVFYLLFLAGDYLTRTGAISPPLGAWGATVMALLVGAWGAFSRGRLGAKLVPGELRALSLARATHHARAGTPLEPRRFSLLGLLDRTIIATLAAHFSVALVGLVAVFLLFTFFEMLRFSAAGDARLNLIGLYLFYLTPLAVEGVTPAAALIAILTTYALLARWGESISWFSSGQSLYRLALPSLLFTLTICCAFWIIQEQILPSANVRQEILRSRIRRGPARGDAETGTAWLATPEGRVYSYQYDAGTNTLKSPAVYVFDEAGIHLRKIINADQAREGNQGGTHFENAVSVGDINRPIGVPRRQALNTTFDDPTPFYLFKPALKKPEEYDTASISAYIKRLKANNQVSPEVTAFVVALWRRRSEPVSPLIMWFIGVPLGLAFGRRTVIMPLLLAVVMGICHWVGSAILAQAAIYGLIPPYLSATALPILFLLLGVYYFSRART
ncbi:MAG: LptF/LptG family permease [Pyrinomonadaceae bacterium]